MCLNIWLGLRILSNNMCTELLLYTSWPRKDSLMVKVRSSPAWELLILEVGTIATRWINTGEPIKTWRGIMALSGMFRLGEIYAGNQLAQSLFYKADTTRIDKQLALEVIEFSQLLSALVSFLVYAVGNED
ncbi:Uncharacterised protein [Klebsiella pneumoniae]|nr:Uncharacterised protein [Klebsiella pneumoniae]VGE63622.1 Uncharacterised protein [Klebsiella pneumoniae]